MCEHVDVSGRRNPQFVGPVHKDLIREFPWVAPIVALHLSDMDGVPMHAVDNGWYWAGGTSWNGAGAVPPPNASHLATVLRISAEEAAQLTQLVLDGMTKAAFSARVDTMRPRWADEARAARALMVDNLGCEPILGEETEERPRIQW